jgi:hypothetical protein
MKNQVNLGMALLLLNLAIGCKEAKTSDESAVHASTEKSATTKSISSNAAVETNENKRKFIRTADVKFRVKNVAESTYAIESNITKHGGFITFTDLKSNIISKEETQISQDSIVEVTRFTVDNTLTFRVPNTQLDNVLTSIASQVAFLDSRLIKADDVSLQFKVNQLAQNRLDKYKKRLENGIDSKGKKLTQITDAEENLLEKQSQNDNTTIENLSMEDSINFSTVTLYFYQRESTTTEKLPLINNVSSYRPHIGIQIFESIKKGWFILEEIVAFVLQLWSLLLIVLLGCIVYKKLKKK